MYALSQICRAYFSKPSCFGCQTLFGVLDFGYCEECFIFLNRHWQPTRKHEPLLHYSLFHWKKSETLAVSLLIKNLKGARYKGALLGWGHQLGSLVTTHFSLAEIDDWQRRGAFVVYPPSGSSRLENHAQYLAQGCAQELGLSSVTEMLLSTEVGEQKTRFASERHRKRLILNEKNSGFLRDQPVIFVDDIVTTGSTAYSAWEALKKPKDFIVLSLATRARVAH